MSIRISLDNPPEFYTNLDEVKGRVVLGISRPEVVSSIVVKLEGEARTALQVQPGQRVNGATMPGRAGNIATENHKLLYRVQQVYPEESQSVAMQSPSTVIQPGQHSFPFQFKMPVNNICHDPAAMASLVGVGGVGGAGQPGLLTFGGFRTMDGTRQLFLQHVKSTLPPSLTGFPNEAEIRYYIKVTIARPGFFKENWRYQLGFKFLPIEPPRPRATSQEAFARRPFVFKPRTPAPQLHRKSSSFFGGSKGSPKPEQPSAPPSFEMAARLPHPTLLTCNETLPLRILAKKLADVNEQVYLISLNITLVGYTEVRVQTIQNVEVSKWVIVSAPNLSIGIGSPTDAVNSEFEIPNHLWAERRLPNTVAPSFKTCNLVRRYELEVQLSLSWGLKGGKGAALPQVLHLPLKLSNVHVLSGIKPPPQLVASLQAATNDNAIHTPRPPKLPSRPSQGAAGQSSSSHGVSSSHQAPQQPPRPVVPTPTHDPLYPPQLGPGDEPNYDDAPPSYDEAVAATVPPPDTTSRPAYSGVTAENAPSTIPEGGRNEKG